MKQFVLFGLFMGFFCCALAQTITVVDIETGKPLEGAMVSSEDGNTTEITNKKGQVSAVPFQTANAIVVRSLGYALQRIDRATLMGSNYRVSMKAAALQIDDIVVSATRWNQTSSKVPSKTVSITPQEVTLQNPQTAADLLGVSGKVFIQKSQQGGGSPMIRGFATNRLIYTVDGVRMNTAIFRGGNIQNVINLDPFAMERTEVLFGPGSVVYGSDAIGGVMSFQSITPAFSDSSKPAISGSAVARYATANQEKAGHFDIRLGFKKWAFATSVSAWDFDHLRQGRFGPDDYVRGYYVQEEFRRDAIVYQEDELLQIPSGYSQVNLTQKVRYRPKDHLDLQYGFHFSSTSPYGRYDRHNRIRNGLPRYAQWDYGPQRWMMNHLELNYTKPNVVFDGFTARVAHQSFEESRISRDFQSLERERRTENVNAYSLNLDFTKKLPRRNTLFYGAEYVLNDVRSDGVNELLRFSFTEADSVADGPDRYPQATWQSAAVYVQNEFEATDDITLLGGIRYNHFFINADFSENQAFYPLPFSEASFNNGALTGSLGAVFRPMDDLVVKANIGTAFRAPNVDDMGKIFDSEPGTVVVPNPDLQAEYAYSFDLGLAKIFNDQFKVDITGYYTLLRNALVRRNSTLNGMDSIFYDGLLSQVQTVQNAASANVYGVQAGFELKLPKGFTFLTDVNYQVGEEVAEDGTTLPTRHAAPFFGVSRLRYKNKRLTLELNTMYQGAVSHDRLAISERGKDEIYALDENGNTYAPAWYTLNLKSFVKVTDVFGISAGVENITDRRYRPYSSGLSGAGRNFILSVRADF